MSHTASHEELRGLAALYALGALDGEEAGVFERHLREGCGACAEELRDYESVAAQLAPPVEPPPSARAKLLARVAREPRDGGGGGGEGARAPGRQGPSQFVGPTEFLVVRGGEGEWVETADAGVSVKLLFVDKERDTVTTLVRLQPGARITSHRHLGVEQCLVLEGDVLSGGLVLHAGDFNCAMKGSVHDEIYSERGALLLLVSPDSYEQLGRGGDRPRAV